jgi:hypothetical protein
MTIELKNNKNVRLNKLAELLETQPVIHFQPDDSQSDFELVELLKAEDGHTCLKVIQENVHSVWVINTDWPHIEFVG